MNKKTLSRFTSGTGVLIALLAVAGAWPALAQSPAPATPITPASAPEAAPGLSGPQWTLVEFQSMDDTTLKPEAGHLYTLRFVAGGRLEVQADCARGKGTWKSPGAAQVEIGPVAMTRIACPPSPLNTRFVRDLAYVRSYVLRDGRLSLSLMADGGIYTFAPEPGQ